MTAGSSNRYDAIIVGGGHNGLVAAAYLARAGRKVVVLERRHIIGGAAVTEEIFPGFKFSVFSYVVSLLRPEIIRDLSLPSHGLLVLPLESTITPMDNGDYLASWADRDETRRELERHSPKDAEAAVLFNQLMHHMAMAVRPILGMVPPDPTSLAPSDLRGLLRLGAHFRQLGGETFHALHKLMTMSSADYLDEWYEFDPLKATKSASGIIGTMMGPRSPGSAYVLLHHYMGEIDGAFRAWGFQKGGTGAISESIASAARSGGAEIRTSAAVAQVIVKQGRAIGVALANGDEIYAPVVVSSLDPKRTFLDLIARKELPADFVEGVERYKFRGSSGKVNLALSGLPEFTCLKGDSALALRAARGAVSIYAPYNLNGGWTDARREAFGDAVVDTLSRYAPNLKSLIMHRQVLTPVDIERITGLTEGNIFAGELALNQLFFLRPFAGYARYRTPIRDYWQCGAGTHPGGGIMGASGRLAALEILRSR